MTERPIYRLFGFDVASDLPLRGVPRSRGPARLSVARADGATAEDPPAGEPLYTSPYRTEDGERVARLYRRAQGDVLRFAGVADFHFEPERLLVHIPASVAEERVEIRLLGPVMACWLEARGLPVLHASAVAVGEGAVGFLAGNRGGKSTLAAALMAAGHPLLADDLLAVEAAPEGFLARPAYPQMRFWPEQARRLTGTANWPRVLPGVAGAEKVRVAVGQGGFGGFCPRSLPLRRLYLPRWREGEGGGGAARIEAVPPRDGLVELLRASFVGALAEAAGWAEGRFDLLARLAAAVPLRRLVLPAGVARLPEVVAAVLADVEGAR